MHARVKGQVVVYVQNWKMRTEEVLSGTASLDSHAQLTLTVSLPHAVHGAGDRHSSNNVLATFSLSLGNSY